MSSPTATCDAPLWADAADCQRIARRKYGSAPTRYMAARLQAGYYSPEDQYEALLDRLVAPQQSWLDIGGGRAPFANNPELSAELSSRCGRLVGVDPDGAILENPYVHEGRQAMLEQFRTDETFDLLTARMVVEHVDNPRAFVDALARLARPGAMVVFLTVNRRSLTAQAASWSPMAVHHWLKHRLWRSHESDTFPTVYRMNDRKTLRQLMGETGFDEAMFRVLPDASLFWRFPRLRRMELAAYKLTRRMGLPYIDSNILGVYRRRAA